MCYDKIMLVMTKLCFLRQIFVMTKVLMWQTHVCHIKHNFVATKVLSRQHISVTTKEFFCHHKHMFVTTKLLSRQKLYLWQLPPTIAKTLFFFFTISTTACQSTPTNNMIPSKKVHWISLAIAWGQFSMQENGENQLDEVWRKRRVYTMGIGWGGGGDGAGRGSYATSFQLLHTTVIIQPHATEPFNTNNRVISSFAIYANQSAYCYFYHRSQK